MIRGEFMTARLKAFVVQLRQDLVGSLGAEVLFVNRSDLDLQVVVTKRAPRR